MHVYKNLANNWTSIFHVSKDQKFQTKLLKEGKTSKVFRKRIYFECILAYAFYRPPFQIEKLPPLYFLRTFVLFPANFRGPYFLWKGEIPNWPLASWLGKSRKVFYYPSRFFLFISLSIFLVYLIYHMFLYKSEVSIIFLISKISPSLSPVILP